MGKQRLLNAIKNPTIKLFFDDRVAFNLLYILLNRYRSTDTHISKPPYEKYLLKNALPSSIAGSQKVVLGYHMLYAIRHHHLYKTKVSS